MPLLREELLERLVCPRCTSTGSATAASPRLSRTPGGLRCGGCEASYPVEGGVPDLRVGQHSEQVERAFSQQWRLRAQGQFEDGAMLYGARHEMRASDVEARLKQSLARGGSPWVLDAGCGPGDMVAALATRYPRARFIGLDLSDAVRDAARRMRATPNLYFVQADVTHPPFASDSFQAAWSFGVLHHAKDTREAFAALAQRVEPKGELTIWLYPHPSELETLSARDRLGIRLYYALRDRVFAGRGHRLPPTTLLRLVRILSAPARLVSLPRAEPSEVGGARRALYPSLVFVLFDALAPAYQHRHRREEVLQWFHESGFVGLRSGPLDRGEAHSIGAYTGTRA